MDLDPDAVRVIRPATRRSGGPKTAAVRPQPQRGRPDVIRTGDDANVYVLDRRGEVARRGTVRRIGPDMFLYMTDTGEEGRRRTEWEAFLALGYVLHPDGTLTSVSRLATGNEGEDSPVTPMCLGAAGPPLPPTDPVGRAAAVVVPKRIRRKRGVASAVRPDQHHERRDRGSGP